MFFFLLLIFNKVKNVIVIAPMCWNTAQKIMESIVVGIVASSNLGLFAKYTKVEQCLSANATKVDGICG